MPWRHRRELHRHWQPLAQNLIYPHPRTGGNDDRIRNESRFNSFCQTGQDLRARHVRLAVSTRAVQNIGLLHSTHLVLGQILIVFPKWKLRLHKGGLSEFYLKSNAHGANSLFWTTLAPTFPSICSGQRLALLPRFYWLASLSSTYV